MPPGDRDAVVAALLLRQQLAVVEFRLPPLMVRLPLIDELSARRNVDAPVRVVRRRCVERHVAVIGQRNAGVDGQRGVVAPLCDR